PLPALLPRHGLPQPRPALPGSRPAPGPPGGGRPRPLLPAGARLDGAPHRRGGGAATLVPPLARPDVPGGVPLAGRGLRALPDAGPLGAADGLPAGSRM